MAQGFGLVEEFSRGGVLIGLGVCIGKCDEKNVENGEVEENCGSHKVP